MIYHIDILKNKIQMIKRCSTSLIIREMQNKTTIRYYLIPSSKCLQTINARREGGEKGTLLHQWKHKLVHPLGRTIWRFHKELKIELPHDQEISLLSIYLEKTLIQKYTCTPMFTVSLFITAKTWKWMDSFVHYII